MMRRAVILGTIVGLGLAVAGVSAQRGGGLPPSGAIQKIKDNLYKIPGAGSNTTVFLTEAGVVLVDTQLANNGEAIMNQIKTVTSKPVSLIINTHSHPDHMGSNDFFPPTVEKVTHVNAQKQMAANPQYASIPATMPNSISASSDTTTTQQMART
jgi:glyoxylase-like metal-dependent hydrolase (beta-lactamase superfamily II)